MDMEHTKEVYLTPCLKLGSYLSNLKGEREGREKASGKKKIVSSGKIKGFLEEIRKFETMLCSCKWSFSIFLKAIKFSREIYES